MNRPLPVVLCAVIIALILTAGCTSSNQTKTGANALVTASPGLGSAASSAGNGASSGVCGGAAFDIDPANCGKCGAVCPENAICSSGNCYCRDGFKADNNQCVALPAGTTNGCPQGMSPCSSTYCFELQTDRSNCGLCGYSCPSTRICSAGICVNAVAEPTGTSVPSGGSCDVPGQTKCGSRCVNTTTNSGNCGSCGKICYSAAPNCCNGACVDYSKDTSNCGFCGHTCAPGATCSLGSCRIKVTGIVYSAMTVAPSFAK